jgi:hypothetical protein
MAELSKNDRTDLLDGEDVDDYFLDVTSEVSVAESTATHGNLTLFVPMPIPSVIEAVASVCQSLQANVFNVEHKYSRILEQLRPNFAWASTERVKASLEASTQFYCANQ